VTGVQTCALPISLQTGVDTKAMDQDNRSSGAMFFIKNAYAI
jgi:hypothetical protein